MKNTKKIVGLLVTSLALTAVATACGGHEHAWGEFTSNGDGTHTRVCAGDATHVETVDCNGGTATCKEAAVCVDCGTAYGATVAHEFTKKDTAEKFMCAEATCQAPATYYYSCVACGTKGEETFSEGNVSTEHTYNQKVAEQKYLKTEATCEDKAVYYQSCVCGAHIADENAETFEYGTTSGHKFTQAKAEDKYLVSKATCSSPATYRKSCEVCSEASTEEGDVFQSGDTAQHDFTADIVDAKYAAPTVGYYYYSCTMCKEAGTTTFNGYDNQDDSWNVVSNDLLNDATDAEKINATVRPSITTDAKGVQFVSATEEDRVTVVRLEDIQGGVGGKTEGIFYKVLTTNSNNTKFGFTIMPTHTKAEYEAYLAKNADAELSFDVYLDPVGGWQKENGVTNRQVYLNATAYSPQNREIKKWHSFAIPLSTLIANWDKLGDTQGTYTNADYRYTGIFNYANGYEGKTDESGCFYIGNFNIAGYNKKEDNTPPQTPTGSAWNTVSASNITSSATTSAAKYYLNGTAKNHADQISVVTLTTENSLGGKTEGSFYKVEPTSALGQKHGFALDPLWTKEQYQAYLDANADAALTFEFYLAPTGGWQKENGITYRQTFANATAYAATNSEINKWHTVSIPLATILANWDKLGSTSATAADTDYRARCLFNYAGSYSGQTDATSCYYIGNFQIAGFLEFYAD